jgi:hypothetical protein
MAPNSAAIQRGLKTPAAGRLLSINAEHDGVEDQS